VIAVRQQAVQVAIGQIVVVHGAELGIASMEPDEAKHLFLEAAGVIPMAIGAVALSGLMCGGVLDESYSS